MNPRTHRQQRMVDRAFLTVLDYTKGQRLCEIARRLDMNAVSASRRLARMEDAGEIYRTQEGKRWLFWRTDSHAELEAHA